MTRHILFALMLATGAVLVHDDSSAQQPAAGANEAQGSRERAQVKTEAPATAQQAQVPTDDATAPTAEPQAPAAEGGQLIATPGSKALGMSILGNQEAPTSLVIVPWKSSELGDSVGISPMLDGSRGPVDKDVFMRALRYYEIRSEGSRGRQP